MATTATLNEKRSQIFRESSSTQTVNIPARPSDDGEYIILWDDILLTFPNASRVLNGENVVLFLVDKSFKYLEPKRIPHQPGVILDVITKTEASPPFPRFDPVLTPISPTLETDEFHFDIPASEAMQIDNSDEPLVPIPTCQIDQSTAKYSSSPVSTYLVPSTNSSFYPDRRLTVTSRPVTSEYDYYAQSIIVGQEYQTSILKDAIDRRFNDLQVELVKNHSLQLQVYNNQLQMEVNQKEMLQIQKQTLDRLEKIHNQIQTVMVNNYQLYEDPMPRLFIILPQRILPLTTSLPQQNGETLDTPEFRLYFLCECGRHTMTPDTEGYHTVHIAKHQGYDLVRPMEFYKKYGNHILALLQMLKYGYTSREMTVLTLDEFEKSGGMDVVKDIAQTTKKTSAELVDISIEFLQNIFKDSSSTIDASDSTDYKALDSADLKQLESNLKVSESSRSLGNLYRMVSPEGFVKWICADHYREKYRHSATQKFKDFVACCEGIFLEESGKVVVSIDNTQSKGFYEVLEQVRGVQDLDVTLNWDVSLDDLRKLGTAVTRANITHFSINGSVFKGPARDIVNRNRRYDPIMQIMGNGRVQLLQIKHIQNFFVHVSSSSIKFSPSIRVLCIDSTLKVSDKSFRSHLMGILSNCPALTELQLKLSKPSQFLELVSEKFNRVLKLEGISLKSEKNDREIELKYTRVSARSQSYPPLNGSTNDVVAGNPQRKSNGNLLVRITSEGWWSTLNKQSVTFHKFGHFIKEIKVNGILNDSVVQGLCESVVKNEPKLRCLLLDTKDLSPVGLKSMLQVLSRSESLERLELVFHSLHERPRLSILKEILTNSKYNNVLRELTISGDATTTWMEEIATTIPQGLPKLERLNIEYKGFISPSLVEWIATTAANTFQEDTTQSPKPVLHSTPNPQPSNPPENANPKVGTPGNLKALYLVGIKLQPNEWTRIIKALNLSKLEHIGFPNTNFSAVELDVLAERIIKTPNLAMTMLILQQTLIESKDITPKRYQFLTELDSNNGRNVSMSLKVNKKQ
ncbi:hypothetical protein BGZ76_003030 [Entomortierella beljakovae]|nr:hypothetical protein BGZ76_003030 [Entomortierella beljakovae]